MTIQTLHQDLENIKGEAKKLNAFADLTLTQSQDELVKKLTIFTDRTLEELIMSFARKEGPLSQEKMTSLKRLINEFKEGLPSEVATIIAVQSNWPHHSPPKNKQADFMGITRLYFNSCIDKATKPLAEILENFGLCSTATLEERIRRSTELRPLDAAFQYAEELKSITHNLAATTAAQADLNAAIALQAWKKT